MFVWRSVTVGGEGRGGGGLVRVKKGSAGREDLRNRAVRSTMVEVMEVKRRGCCVGLKREGIG